MGGRSAVERMPGGAAHTYGTAFTGRFAVYAGVNDPRSSSGIGNGSSTSNGASPCTRTRHPVACKSHAGSRSVLQYQVGVKRTASTPCFSASYTQHADELERRVPDHLT